MARSPLASFADRRKGRGSSGPAARASSAVKAPSAPKTNYFFSRPLSRGGAKEDALTRFFDTALAHLSKTSAVAERMARDQSGVLATIEAQGDRIDRLNRENAAALGPPVRIAVMAEPEKPSKASGKASWMPSPKKIGEFLLGVVQLQRSVDALKNQNEQLADEVRRLQRQVDEQAGQLKAIQSFIQTAVYEHAARSGERAALTFVQEFLETGDRGKG